MDDNDRTASLMTPARLATVQFKEAPSPAVWLDHMAADAGHAHVRRLSDLQSDLRVQGQAHDITRLAAEVGNVLSALPRLDFGLLRSQGLLARLSGRSRTAGAQFMSRYQQIEDGLGGLAAQASTLLASQGEQARSADIALLELEVETRALLKIVEQGARWLHDMRNQLKAREAEGGDDAQRQEIRRSAARCETLVTRLRALRAAAAAAQQVHHHARDAAARRAALVQLLQQSLSTDVREWRRRVSTLAAAAAEGRTADTEEAMESHRELQLCVKQVLADCGELQSHEQTLDASLHALAEQLAACAS